jgi:hypothetical protein
MPRSPSTLDLLENLALAYSLQGTLLKMPFPSQTERERSGETFKTKKQNFFH